VSERVPGGSPDRIVDVARAFAGGATVAGVSPCGAGHIHDSFTVTLRARDGAESRLLLQRINRSVFASPDELASNVARVTEHVRAKVAEEGGDPARGALTIVPAGDGQALHRTHDGDCFRAFRMIDGARSFATARDATHAFEAARAFGRFVRRLTDLPPPRLHETIPRFADPGGRHDAFLRAVDDDVAGRAGQIADELRFVERHAALLGEARSLFAPGALPERVVHHDTKIDNVLIDDETGAGICVVDLDTTMPGRVLFDFGDLVRLGATCAAEDERDLARVRVDPSRLAALGHGYLEETAGFLIDEEVAALAVAGPIVALTLGLRFLTDYLDGDRYFKTHRPGQNLDRARVHLTLVGDLEHRTADLHRLLRGVRSRISGS
jgi:Ser/Thr protein kinase RdoA (MazF antagonist)